MTVTVSASVSFTLIPDTTVFTQASKSVELTVTNPGNETEAFTIPSGITISDGTNSVAVSLSEDTFSIEGGQSKKISASINPSELDAFNPGIYSTTAEIKAQGATENATQTATFKAEKSYCENGPLNTSIIEIRDVSESGSSSDKEWTWYPQDKITLSVDVKNRDADNDRAVRVMWDLYSPQTNEFLDIGNDDTVDVNSEDQETVEFTFDVPYDLERGSYILFVKAFDDDEGEDQICSVAKENGKSALLGETEGITIDLQRDRNDVAVVKNNLPTTLSCGSTTDVGLWIANLGRGREDKIKVTMLDSVFGAETSREISKLNWDDKAKAVSFPLEVAKDTKEGNYVLKFKIEYKYDKDKDTYDLQDTISYNINVKGNCVIAEKVASITAGLESSAVEGEQLTIKGTLKNNGDKATFSLDASGFSDWAELSKIEPTTITLDKGESADFSVYLNVKTGTAGDQLLTLSAKSNGQSFNQQVSVAVEPSQGKGTITGAAIASYLKNNWFIWVIVVINIILIIAIIVVARRIAISK